MADSTRSKRGARRRGWRPAVAGVLAFVALLGAWVTLAGGRVPAPLLHPNHSDGRLVWAAPGVGPFHAIGPVERADVLFVGDSRIHDAIALEVCRERGLEAAILWGPGAYLPDLLPLVERFPARTVVVGLSFFSLIGQKNALVTEALSEPPPPPSPLAAAAEASRWEARARARLVEAGADELTAARFTADLAGALALHYEHVGWFTGPLDRRLSEWVDERRTRLVPTISTRPWASTEGGVWFEARDPTHLAKWAGGHAKESRRRERRIAGEAIVEELRRLVVGGRRVVCVRLPVSKAVGRAVSSRIPDDELREVARDAGVPLLEHQEAPLETRDGSHLTWEASRDYTGFLLEALGR